MAEDHACVVRGKCNHHTELCIRALAELVESPGGALWLRRGGDGFVPAAELNMALATSVEPLDGGLAEFMNRTGWVIDLDEFRARPEAYLGFDAPEWLVSIPPRGWSCRCPTRKR